MFAQEMSHSSGREESCAANRKIKLQSTLQLRQPFPSLVSCDTLLYAISGAICLQSKSASANSANVLHLPESDTPVAVTRRGQLRCLRSDPRQAPQYGEISERRRQRTGSLPHSGMPMKKNSSEFKTASSRQGLIPLNDRCRRENILIRAVLGRRVRQLIDTYAGNEFVFRT